MILPQHFNQYIASYSVECTLRQSYVA